MKVWAAKLLGGGITYVLPSANSIYVSKRLGVTTDTFVYCAQIKYSTRNGEMAPVACLDVRFDDGTAVTADASAFLMFYESGVYRG